MINSAELFFSLFADDSTATCSDFTLKSTLEKLTKEFAKVIEWLKANKLIINLQKTHIMVFTNKEKPNSFSLNHLPPSSGVPVDPTAQGRQIPLSPKPVCISAVTFTAPHHLLSIGLIILVLINASYSEIRCPASVELINRPLADQSSRNYGPVSITRAVELTAAAALPPPLFLRPSIWY